VDANVYPQNGKSRGHGVDKLNWRPAVMGERGDGHRRGRQDDDHYMSFRSGLTAVKLLLGGRHVHWRGFRLDET
jgi:hypothetical protein